MSSFSELMYIVRQLCCDSRCFGGRRDDYGRYTHTELDCLFDANSGYINGFERRF